MFCGDIRVRHRAVRASGEKQARVVRRDIAPLKPADDAIIIDTSNLSIDEQVQKVIEIVQQYQDN